MAGAGASEPGPGGRVADLAGSLDPAQAQALLAGLLEGSQDGVVAVEPQGTIVVFNPAAARIFGYPPREVLGRSLDLLLPERHTRAHHSQVEAFAVNGSSHRIMGHAGVVIGHRRDGSEFPAYVSLARVAESDPVLLLATVRDLTRGPEMAELSRAFEESLAVQATHDALTGLPNRVLLTDRIRHALDRRASSGGLLAILLCDLDNFKVVNDSLGHAAGDRLLVETAERIQAALRPGDTVARFGGDEFVVLCEDLASFEEVDPIATRLHRALDIPYLVGERELRLGASIGVVVARAGEADGDPDALVRDADTAMFEAKSAGRGRVLYFDAEMHRRADRRLRMEGELRSSLRRADFVLEYQPVFSLAGGWCRSVEALVRWRHPELGLLAPGDFVGLAEETGLITELGEWVLHEGCRQLAEWDRDGLEGLMLSVNLSPVQLSVADLARTVEQALLLYGVEPKRLCLEITETALVQDPQAAREVLSALHALGVGVALDDFGTGAASLSHLRMFPVTELKIDRSFVAGICTSPEDATIVATVIAMGETLGLDVVAEGIETPEQLAELRSLGCPFAQGFHLARPTPADRLCRAVLGAGSLQL